MKVSSLFLTSGAVASAVLGAMVSVVPATPAMAQSGSRLCGWSAPTPTGYIGILYEARQDDASYSQQCDEAVDEINSEIKSNPNLKSLTWTKHYKATCESVGEKFMSSNSPKDMCDKMEAKKGYQVVKTTSTNSTTYTKT